MKKLVVKTIAFSLGILLVGACLFYLIVATCVPSSLSDFYYRTGNEKLTLKYSEKAYGKSDDIEDLATLVERSIVFDEHALVKAYGFKFLNHSGFSDYISGKNDGYKYYIVGSLVDSLYELSETQTAVDVAFNNTNAYTKVNPIRVLISKSLQKEDKLTLSYAYEKLVARENKNQLVINDISLIRDYLN